MPKFIPIQELIKLPLLANDDVLQRGKGRLLAYSKYVFLDMNLSTVKIAKRQSFDINKRTNSITLPPECLQFSSVNIMDSCGAMHPVFRNDNIHDDLIDVPADKDCACEFKCGYKLCNTIKGYEAVISVKTDSMPNGDPVSFTCVDRKAINDNGFFYEELQYPKRIYTDGIWTDTIKFTEQNTLCKVQVDDNGCVCDTEQNIDSLCSCLGLPPNIPFGGTASCPPSPNVDTWIYYCNSKLDWFSFQCGCPDICCDINNTYNISEDGNRLLFPKNFGFSKVIVRFYADINLRDLQIPFIAADTFIMGLKYWDCKFNDKKQKLAAVYGDNYSKMKWGLFTDLNKYRISEMRMIMTPPVFIPSYLSLDGYNNNIW